MEPTPHQKSVSEAPQAEAAFVGIDWGSTHRRVMALDASGRLVREFDDDAGLLHVVVGGWAAALGEALARAAPLAAQAKVVLSGMVGSAQGWHPAPYLDAPLSLEALGERLFDVPDAPAGVACQIVPGVRWRHGGKHVVDVMRGEETQLLGAVANGLRDAVVVLPGTHSKWVRLRDGRIEEFATYMTGELFALLSQHGTLAPLLLDHAKARSHGDAGDADEAFGQGLQASQGRALSSALFGCRAAVVSGQLPQASAREYLSGVLIGSEWHDAIDRFLVPTATNPVQEMTR